MGTHEHEIDIVALARRARALGYDEMPRLAQRLQAIIERNLDYLGRRRRRTAYDQALEEDNEALAMAILLLESIGKAAKSNVL